MNNLMVVLNGLPVCAQSQTYASTASVGPVLHGLTEGEKDSWSELGEACIAAGIECSVHLVILV